jgi:OOP family OmpA-OmpF porin
MKSTKLLSRFTRLFVLASVATLFGCAHYEVNTGRGQIPGHWIRYEMQEADRAVEAARAAGKDQTCPAEFKQAEDAKNKAYDVFRACHTEEGVALAKQATAMANALCPPVAAAVVPVVVPPAEPAPANYKYCITLHNEFDIDKAIVRSEDHREIARVGDFMKKYPTTTAVIEGHSDNVGSAEYNLDLSQRRAEAVVNYLVDNFGIDRSRLSAKGYGLSRPVADNATNEGRQKNRRIEAIIDCAFDVQKIEPPDSLCMALVLDFDTGKSDIKPQYHGEIAKVGNYMKEYPTTTAVIEGHTDNVGAPDYNMKLSLERAQSTVNYLVQNFGIDPSRLTAKGFGDTKRIAYNSTAEGRAQNRRINAIIDCVIIK